MRILLLGASGFVGGALRLALAARHEVVGTRAGTEAPGLLRVDLTDDTALTELVRQDFDLVVHAAGLVDLERAETDPELAWRLNAGSVETLSRAVDGRSTRVVYLSSDNVFDGSREVYTEDDEPAPANTYGRTKLAAERLLAAGPHLVVRIPLVYGRSPVSDRFFARFAGPRTEAQVDIRTAPVYLPSLAPALETLWHLSGIVHFGGAETLTRYELMSRIRDGLKLPTTVVPVRNADLPTGWLRPHRLVLTSARHDLAGPDLDTALADLRRRRTAPAAGAPIAGLPPEGWGRDAGTSR